MSEGHVSVLFEFNSRRRVMNENSLSNGSKLSLLGTWKNNHRLFRLHFHNSTAAAQRTSVSIGILYRFIYP